MLTMLETKLWRAMMKEAGHKNLNALGVSKQ